ncbi:MAG TPA: Calx-beta domain-containing protein, partial [Thermoanaerobaculia bacterium]
MNFSAVRRLVSAAAMLFTLPIFAAGTFTVTNVNDSGAGSLRQAILDANAEAGRIVFAIGNGPQSIRPLSSLPQLSQVTIDGTTQPGYNGTPLIELDGTLLVTGSILNAQNSSVTALVLNRAPFAGILAQNTTVSGCFVGTDASGMIARANDYGIVGTGVWHNNLVSGNQTTNLLPQPGTTVQNNLVGTDVTGNAILARPVPTVLNVNTTPYGGGTLPIKIQNNVIGGGSTGILVQGGAPTISGNFVGVSRTGTRLPNGTGVRVDLPDTTLNANTIANNHRAVVIAQVAIRTQLINNTIRGNAFGVDLVGTTDGPSGETLNDDGDRDVGPNNLMNFPVITSAVRGAAETTVTGTLSTHPNVTATIELFVNPSCDASGYGQGAQRFARFNVVTNGAGTAAFMGAFPGLSAGQVITANASTLDEGTSEFSLCAVIEGPGQFALSSATFRAPEDASSLSVEVRRQGGAAGPATVYYATANGTATAGSDYTPVSGVLVFADHEIVKTIVVPLLTDTLFEGPQTFTIALSNAT